MNHIYQWNKKSSPYNSLNIYAKYLGTLIEKIWGIESTYIYPDTDNYIDIIKEATQEKSTSIIFWHYGVFDPNIKYIEDYSKVVFIYHNITPAKYFWLTNPLSSLRAIGTYIQLLLLPRKANWITVSDFNRICLKPFGFKRIESCPLIPYNVSNRKYSKNTECTLLYVGRIIENKNCINLLLYIKRLAKMYNKTIRFIIVGECTTSNFYKLYFQKVLGKLQKIDNLKLEWIANVDTEKLHELYQSCWLYVSTSLHEGLGMPVCEAILHGTPAIYMECGGQESVLNSLGMIPLGNSNKFADKVLELISDENKRNSLLEAQISELKKKDWPKSRAIVSEIYGKYIISD